MGRHPSGRKYQVERVQDRHREIVRRLIMGQENKQIAEALGVTPQMVSIVRNSKHVQDHMQRLHEKADNHVVDITERLKSLRPLAVDCFQRILESEGVDQRLQVKVADSVLDRTGYKPTQVISANVNHTSYTPDEIEELKKRALAAKNVVDVKAESSEGAE